MTCRKCPENQLPSSPKGAAGALGAAEGGRAADGLATHGAKHHHQGGVEQRGASGGGRRGRGHGWLITVDDYQRLSYGTVKYFL